MVLFQILAFFITVIISQICSLFLGSVLVIYMSIENHVTSSFSSILGALPQSCFLFQVFTCPPLFFLAVAHVCTHRKILDFLLNKKKYFVCIFLGPQDVAETVEKWRERSLSEEGSKSCFLCCDCPAGMWLQGIHIFQSFLKSSWVCVRYLLTFQINFLD